MKGVLIMRTIKTSDITLKRLSEDRATAIAKMVEIEEIYRCLPHLDCGSCGAPNCHALAEDIVRGNAKVGDCLIRLREEQKKN